jgi:hypothetical protein
MPYANQKSLAAIESRRRRSKRYRDTHPECAQKTKAWLAANSARVNELSVIRRSQKLAPSKVLYNNAKNRAKACGIAFDLTVDDLVVPAVCPVLGIPLVVGTGFARDGSPSVDRFDPKKGYVRGNVRVISHKANTIKSNATIEDIRRVLAYLESTDGW